MKVEDLGIESLFTQADLGIESLFTQVDLGIESLFTQVDLGIESLFTQVKSYQWPIPPTPTSPSKSILLTFLLSFSSMYMKIFLLTDIIKTYLYKLFWAILQEVMKFHTLQNTWKQDQAGPFPLTYTPFGG